MSRREQGVLAREASRMLGAPAAMETLDRVLDLVVREADSDRATPARAGEGQTPARPFEMNL